MKVLRKLIVFLYLATLLEPVGEIWQLKFYFSTSGELGPFFSTTVVCVCENLIFQVQKMKKFVPIFFFAWFISISLHQCFFFIFSQIFQNEKNKNKKGIFCHNIFIFSIEKIPNFWKQKSFLFFVGHIRILILVC